MAIFVAALIAAIIDRTLLNGAVTYVAIGTGVFTLMIFIALKADGRGFSVTKMNNEIEMEKIEKELAEQEEKEKAEAEEAEEAKEEKEEEKKEEVAAEEKNEDKK